jgi:tol-pal system protein YbgF
VPALPAGRTFSFLAGVLLLLGGCAGVAEVTGTATQQDLMQLRSELATLQLSVQRAQTGAEAASAQATSRVREQALQMDQQTATLSRRLDALAATLTTLTARVEELGTRMEALNRQVRAATPPPVRPGSAPGTSAPSSGTPAAAAPAPLVGSKPATGALGPQDIYQAAYIDFSKGSYALAIAGFREFLRRYPEHELADNSQYWIGECHFSLARGYANAGQQERYVQSLEVAVQEFKKVVANYPRADKAPTALYKEALALLELKQPVVAQSRLQYLVDNFPQAEETQLARERLAALRER